MTLKSYLHYNSYLSERTRRMPVLFVGHGSPMNAIEDNAFTQGWREMAALIPKPKAILCISAHWETKGTQITAMSRPETIHDFGGFPCELFQVEYPAPGSPEWANKIKKDAKETTIELNHNWGLDHGSWSVLKHLYPQADIPVLELSLDYTLSAESHYLLAQELRYLRQKGVLIIGSGNMVHNLRQIRVKSLEGFNEEFGYDWALEMNAIFKQKIMDGDHRALIEYKQWGAAAALAVPTTDHYFPLLYTLALQEKNDDIRFFNDKVVGGSLSMTSVLIGNKS